MAETKASDRMNELIRSLQQAMGRLQGGQLTLEELEQAADQARALYERFVVLRHKAREAAVGAVKKAEAPNPTAEEPKAEEEEAPIRLDTRPPDISPHQTSLIDAIAETENVEMALPPPPSSKAAEPAAQAKPAKPAASEPKTEPVKPTTERPVTLTDKLEHATAAGIIDSPRIQA